MAAGSKTIKTGEFFRSFEFERGAIDETARTVELSCSSEMPVERWFGFEILDHTKESVDLSRFKGRAALLMNHNGGDQVGVVETAEISADRKLRARVRFGKSARAAEVFQDVKDGIRTLVSIGYRVKKMVTEKVENDVETFRATDWMPYEISLVGVPADPSVGVGRAEDPTAKFTTIIERKIVMPEVIPPVVAAPAVAALDPTVALTGTRTDGMKIAGEIFALGREFDCLTEAAQAVAENKSPEAFRKWILENKFKAKPVATGSAADIGMSRAEVQSWSLVRALNRLSNHQAVDGLEKEASDAVAKICRKEAAGFYIPNEVVHGTREQRQALALIDSMSAIARRDLSATGGGNVGGYTIQTDVLGASLIELLRNMTVAFELGARKLGGLVGNVAIPSQNGGATAYWVGENVQTTSSNLAFGQVGLIPHRLSAVTALGKQLLAQSSVDVEGLVREDFARVLAIAIDLAALAGTGTAGQPLGILNTPGIGSVTFGAAATWAKILDFETQVANANALLGSLAYVSTPNTRAKLKAAAKIGTTYPVFIWEKGSKEGQGEINSYRALATKQLAGDKMIYGNWSDLIIADWIGMDVTVDPYTLADKHQIKVTINMLADIGCRHVGSFTASTDSAAQ